MEKQLSVNEQAMVEEMLSELDFDEHATQPKGKPSILLVIDRADWAFANISRQIVKLLSDRFDFTIKLYPEVALHPICREKFDVGVAFWGPSLSMLKENVQVDRWIIGVFDHWTWRTESLAREAWEEAIPHADCLVAVNEFLLEEFRAEFKVKIPAMVTEDGVDTQLFAQRNLPGAFVAGWSGNSKHGTNDYKGLDLIREACLVTGVPLLIQDFQKNGGPIPHEDMPLFYEKISVYVSASNNEGTPNTILEAMSCGRPCITPRQGITRRLIMDGSNGLFVGRTVSDIAGALVSVRGGDIERMGRLARVAAEAHDWTYKAKYWRAVFENALA